MGPLKNKIIFYSIKAIRSREKDLNRFLVPFFGNSARGPGQKIGDLWFHFSETVPGIMCQLRFSRFHISETVYRILGQMGVLVPLFGNSA